MILRMARIFIIAALLAATIGCGGDKTPGGDPLARIEEKPAPKEEATPKASPNKIDRAAELRELYRKLREAEKLGKQDAVHDFHLRIIQIKRSTPEGDPLWKVIEDEEK
jgi:hypothetical protein